MINADFNISRKHLYATSYCRNNNGIDSVLHRSGDNAGLLDFNTCSEIRAVDKRNVSAISYARLNVLVQQD